MKNTLLLCAVLYVATGTSQAQVLVDEDFDTYTAGDLVAETAGAPWNTWSNAPGGSEDTPVSDEQAFSGANSAKWVATDVDGGPTDMVLGLGDQTSGVWAVDFRMFIPTGKGGYFNILHDFNGNTSEWAIEVSFPASGNIDALLLNETTTIGNYPHDEWFAVHVDIDLDADEAELSVNGTSLLTWPFSQQAGSATAGMLQLGAMNFFGYAGGADEATYYLDDVHVASVDGAGIGEHGAEGIKVYPNPATDLLTLDIGQVQGPVQWVLRDATGRTVGMGGGPLTASARTIDVQGLASGMHVLDVLVGGERHVQRFMKR